MGVSAGEWPDVTRPDLSVLAVHAFVSVANAGSFVSAADELGVHSTTVTKLVRRLEEHLSLRLFDRTTRSVTLTSAGRQLLPAAQRVVESAESLLAQAERNAQ